MNKIKLAMIGCGAHSHAHASAIKKIDAINLVSCCDVIEERAVEWAARYGCGASYTDISEMVDTEEVDAVVLCTWPKQHVEQIEACLSAGVKNILCEKALALNSDEALKIGELVRSHQAFLMEGSMYRHHPAIHKIEEFLASGELGRIDSMRAAFSNYEPDDAIGDDKDLDWRFRQDCGGGVAYDWMSYCVNACNHFSGGSPVRVYATGDVSKKHQVINRLYGMIEYDNGNVGIIESSKQANFSQMLQLTCAKGILQLPVAWGIYGDIEIYKHHRKPEWGYIVTNKFEIKQADSFELQLKNFCAVIDGRESPVMPLHESIVNVATVEALVDSLSNRAVVDLLNT